MTEKDDKVVLFGKMDRFLPARVRVQTGFAKTGQNGVKKGQNVIKKGLKNTKCIFEIYGIYKSENALLKRDFHDFYKKQRKNTQK